MKFQGQATLTRDPEMKYLQSGTALCEFGVACNRKDSNGEKVADFFDCKAWQFAAERSAMLRKGQSVIIGGDLQTESWQDKATGAKRSKTVLVCWDIGVCPDTRLGRAEQPAQPHPRQEQAAQAGDDDGRPF